MTPKRKLRVLFVEDREDDALLVMRELRRGGYDLDWRRVETPEALTEAIQGRAWDLVISDWSMPRFNGLEAFRVVQALSVDLPFLIVSGTIGEDIAIEALKAGVHDFMTKGVLTRLLPAIERELRDAEVRREARRVEAEVQQRREETERTARLLRLVVDNVPDAVVVVDQSGSFVLWNAAAEAIGRVSRGERVLPEASAFNEDGIYGFDTLTPIVGEGLPLVRALRGLDVQSEELFIKNDRVPAGVFCNVSARPLRDGHGGVSGAVGVYRDITKEKSAQEQLMIADRMASLGMLAAGVAHEINNPLSTMLANLEIAGEELARVGSPPSATEPLADARAAAERVRDIAQDLKVFSRSEDATRGPVDVNRVLESSLRMAWNEIRHRARVERDLGDVQTVYGSESRLGQVFLNLLINAAQAIPEGWVDRNVIRVTTRMKGSDHVVISITDSGTGMTPETKSRLFTPFFTTKPQNVGTGLGLAICQRIVTSFNGEIRVESEPMRGTTFHVTLERAPAAAPVERQPRPIALGPGRKGKILIVDDESMVLTVMTRLLGHHDVKTELEARAALSRIEGGERFDLILCDMMMPQMTGMDLHGEISRIAPDQAERMVFLTGGAFTPTTREFLGRVGNAQLEKPFQPRELRAFVNARIG